MVLYAVITSLTPEFAFLTNGQIACGVETKLRNEVLIFLWRDILINSPFEMPGKVGNHRLSWLFVK